MAITNPLVNEPGWKTIPRGARTAYTRRLIGSEIWNDQIDRCYDGLAQVFMGFQFETPLPHDEVVSKVRYAWARLRFICPNIAATFEAGIDDPQLRSWVYIPATIEDVNSWLDASVEVLPEPVDPEVVMAMVNKRKLETPGSEQIMRCILFTIPDESNVYYVFMHGTHAIMDARPTFNGFKIMFKAMVETKGIPLEELPWGTEWKNLPAGPVTSTGGPRDDWEGTGLGLINKVASVLADPVPTHSIVPQRSEITEIGQPARAWAQIDVEHTQKIIKAVKAAGCTMTHLFEAAQVLALMKVNPVPPERAAEAHVSFPISIVSLAKWLAPEYKDKETFVSSLTLVPLKADSKILHADLPTREHLLMLMKLFKSQYDEFFANPHLPHLMTALMAMNPPRKPTVTANPVASAITNLGIVEQTVPTLWYPDNDSSKPLMFKISELRFGHRLTKPNPLSHVWTMNNKIYLQVESCDVWDYDYFKNYIEEIRRQALCIIPQE